jgi:hypothetical protein
MDTSEGQENEVAGTIHGMAITRAILRRIVVMVFALRCDVLSSSRDCYLADVTNLKPWVSEMACRKSSPAEKEKLQVW